MRKLIDHLKCILPHSFVDGVKQAVYRVKYQYKQKLKQIEQQAQSVTKQIYLIGGSEHTNIGDAAITAASIQILQEYSQKQCIEISGNLFRYYQDRIVSIIKPNDTLYIVGGGFIGSLWPESNQMILDIIQLFPENTIVILPQSVYFADNEDVIKSKAVKVFNSHRRLHILLRDQMSFDYFTQNIMEDSRQCYQAPDIVTLYTNNKDYNLKERHGIGLCFRKDKEKHTDDHKINELIHFLGKRTIPHNFISTMTRNIGGINTFKRSKYIHDKLDKFSDAKLVITDRLHGVIFCLITSTLCIALDNKSGKVKGFCKTYLKDIQYVRYIDSIDQAYEMIDDMLSLQNAQYHRQDFVKLSQSLIHVIETM